MLHVIPGVHLWRYDMRVDQDPPDFFVTFRGQRICTVCLKSQTLYTPATFHHQWVWRDTPTSQLPKAKIIKHD